MKLLMKNFVAKSNFARFLAKLAIRMCRVFLIKIANYVIFFCNFLFQL